MRRIGNDGLGQWATQRIASSAAAIRAALAEEGVPPAEIDEAQERVARAVTTSLGSERGRWLFAAQHTDARSEFALTTIDEGKLLRIVVDRTFIDDADVRWIVDFKTSVYRGADLEQFLDNELERHRGQLDRCAQVWKRIEQHPVRFGLYWPLHDGWREWSPDGTCRFRAGGNLVKVPPASGQTSLGPHLRGDDISSANVGALESVKISCWAMLAMRSGTVCR